MSTNRAAWTTVSILGLALGSGDPALGRTVLRTAQGLTPRGMRLDLFGLCDDDSPHAAESLRQALVERDALLAVVSASDAEDGRQGLDALTSLFQPLDRSEAVEPRHRVPIAVLHVGSDGDEVIHRLRRSLRAGRACLMPPCRLLLDDGAPAADAERVLAKLLEDIRAWATERGCASVLSDG